MVGSDPAIERVAVVGAGRMGHGIALVYALDGREVALSDADAESAPPESDTPGTRQGTDADGEQSPTLLRAPAAVPVCPRQI